MIFVISRIFKVLKINQSNLQIDIHYSNLEQLLIEQNWGKADYETSLLRQEITNQNRHILYGIERFILKEIRQYSVFKLCSCIATIKSLFVT